MSGQYIDAHAERHQGALIGFGLAALLGAGLWAWLLCSGCVTPPTADGLGNLSLVDTNRGIWRSTQPTVAGFARLASLGVTNSLKLDTDEEGADYAAHIAKFPLDWVKQSVPGGVSQVWIETVLQWLRAHPGTIVHCLHGEDRTGLIIACYRVRFMGWTKAAAEKEMLERGFHPALRGLWEAWEAYPEGPQPSAILRRLRALARPVATNAAAPQAIVAPTQKPYLLIWTNAHQPDPSWEPFLVTGIKWSTNLDLAKSNWAVLYRTPFALSNALVVTNVGTARYFASFNCWQWQ